MNNLVEATLPRKSRPSLGPTQFPIEWVPGPPLPAQSDHSPPSRAELKDTYLVTEGLQLFYVIVVEKN